MVTIPIIELIYGDDGEIEFKIVGKKVVPQSMLENWTTYTRLYSRKVDGVQ
jgi:hypothetical protein